MGAAGHAGLRKVHFVGVCGTAMGSLAAALRDRGVEVTGSDENVYPPMSTFLHGKGVSITAGFDAKNLPADADFVVIGNAMRRGNPEVEAVLNRKLLYYSLPEALKMFFLRGRHNLVVTGTHGKTTTTSLLAWIFESAGLAPSWLIGGIPTNLGQGCRLGDSKYFILEGDEYDTAFFDKRSKFVHYLPELLIVNNIEFDHADIFRDLEDVMTSFRRLLQIVPGEGMVLLNGDDPNCRALAASCPAPLVEVGFSQNAANHIRDVELGRESSAFTLFGGRFEIPMIGEFNVRNAAMAASAAHFYSVPMDEIRKALRTFAGIRRRQEVRGEAGGVVVVDDFGHHPTAIAQTLDGLAVKYPGARLWAVFEPRSNTTRRAVFQDVLPQAFAGAHGVVLAKVARMEQLPENERLNPERVVADLRRAGKEAFYEPDVPAIVGRIAGLARPGDVVVVFSNGGFDNIHTKLLEALGARG
ncbi:MAG: UDP-N-acetylmuramate:L-alanyl-gamma-D-glutamyl-meso-diaminopimelate ligase [Chthoniobacterales bacterium]|nr:UDP-N-acetylmuramate:L-alanyl-gamma-D-glutamyl-meso-diaminopimelate ligase [Chthoniobacterales bacterium]